MRTGRKIRPVNPPHMHQLGVHEGRHRLAAGYMGQLKWEVASGSLARTHIHHHGRVVGAGGSGETAY